MNTLRDVTGAAPRRGTLRHLAFSALPSVVPSSTSTTESRLQSQPHGNPSLSPLPAGTPLNLLCTNLRLSVRILALSVRTISHVFSAAFTRVDQSCSTSLTT